MLRGEKWVGYRIWTQWGLLSLLVPVTTLLTFLPGKTKTEGQRKFKMEMPIICLVSIIFIFMTDITRDD